MKRHLQSRSSSVADWQSCRVGEIGRVMRHDSLQGLMRSHGVIPMLTSSSAGFDDAGKPWSITAASPLTMSTLVCVGTDSIAFVVVVDGRLEISGIGENHRRLWTTVGAGDLYVLLPACGHRLDWLTPDGLAYVIHVRGNLRVGPLPRCLVSSETAKPGSSNSEPEVIRLEDHRAPDVQLSRIPLARDVA